MRTILRVSLIFGIIGFIILYALGAGTALVAAAGILVVGLATGLGIAKWLERPWFGRQLAAGLRAGMVACVLAGLGALLSLLFLGPRDTSTLAARSHLLALDLSPWAQALSAAGWVGADVLSVLAATLGGIALAAFSAQIVAWSKSAHAVQVVAQARQSAQALNRDDAWRATTGIPAMGQFGMSSSGVARATGAPLLGVSGFGAGAPASASGLTMRTPPQGVMPPSSSPANPAPTSVPPAASSVPRPVRFGPPSQQQEQEQGQSPSSPLWPAPTSASSSPNSAKPAQQRRQSQLSPTQQTEPALPSVSAAELAAKMQASEGKERPTQRKPSAARPAGQQLNDAMRDALATWANDNPEAKAAREASEQPTPESEKKPRTPAPSAYLNSSQPAPKRSRKKQNTRDWLC